MWRTATKKSSQQPPVKYPWLLAPTNRIENGFFQVSNIILNLTFSIVTTQVQSESD